MRPSGSAPSASTEGNRLLNVSQIYEWSRCRYRYELGTLKRIQPRRVMRPPSVGSAVHEGMKSVFESLVESQDAGVAFDRSGTQVRIIAAIGRYAEEQVKLRGGIDKIAADEYDDLMAVRTTADLIMERQLRIFEPDRWQIVRHPEFGYPLMESNIVVPIESEYWDGFSFTVDIVLRDLLRSGVSLVGDYKTRKQFTNEEAEEVNFQQIVYQHGLRQIGVETDGTMMWQLKSSAPAQPSLNKNGTMSRARIATDWVTYADALRRAGLNPDDYRDEMKPKLDVEFERMDTVIRSTEVAERAWYDIVIPAADEIGRVFTEDKPSLYRHMGPYNCVGCWARSYCNAELHGEDTDYLLEAQYIDFGNSDTTSVPGTFGPNDVDFTED